jgi:DNA-binding protein YbaB
MNAVFVVVSFLFGLVHGSNAASKPISRKVMAELLFAMNPATRSRTSSSARTSTKPGDVQMLFGGGGGGDGEKKGGMMDALKQAQNMFNPEMMKKYQEMGTKVQELQQELAATELEVTSDDYPGIVMTVSATSVPVSVEIGDELAGKGKEALSEAVTAVVKSAHKQASQYATQRMGELYQELGLPAEALQGKAPPPPAA